MSETMQKTILQHFEFFRRKNGTYVVPIGFKDWTDGDGRFYKFEVGQNLKRALERANRIWDLWLTQVGGRWNEEGLRQARYIAKGHEGPMTGK